MGSSDQNSEARKLILSDVVKDPQKRPFSGPFFSWKREEKDRALAQSAKVNDFCAKYGEADFETGEAVEALAKIGAATDGSTNL